MLQLVNGGALSGGTLNNVGGVGVLRFDASTGNTLNGVTIPNVSALDLSQTGSVLQLRGGTQIGAGSLTLGSSSVVYLNQTAATTPGLTLSSAATPPCRPRAGTRPFSVPTRPGR